MNLQAQSEVQIFRLAEVTSLSGLAKSSWYDRVKRGLLPQPISLGGRAVGWVANEVKTVLKAMIRGDNEAQIKALVIKLTKQRKALL